MTELHQDEQLASRPPDSAGPDGIDILDVLLVLAARRRMIGLVTLTALIAGAILALLLKPSFTATALIMPPQQQSSATSLMGQLGSLAAIGGGASSLGLKTPADMYVGILQSRTIADNIINQFHLSDVYKRRLIQETRLSLKEHTDIEAAKDGLIHISVTDHDPKRASDLANAYVSELYNMNSTLAITEAAQRRVFFDEQLDGERKALATAEEDLRTTQQQTGVIQLSGQTEMIIRTIAQLRAEISSREVEMQAMRTFATEQNPDLARLQQEISTMRQQLSKLENDQDRQIQPGNIAVPAGLVPKDSLEYARKLREVKYHETLFDLLSRQYEAARIDEAKSAPIIQVIDHAVPPDKKSGPHRLLIVLGATIVGFFFSAAYALSEAGIRRIQQIPEHAVRIARLENIFRA